ncbi:hypothetical protein ACJ73_03814 [Blastomyces percursus]|uniref:Uncharacterized protein n=1 Tax=Blastomyces percursus TaxID=1658174 RepID=A0A1J9Q7S3_9EURO|nr:hypothetical protein ACJ73_03814 [Blastomyces percursus]
MGDKMGAPIAPAGREWSHGFWSCCNPFGTCLMTYFCPCMVFGKTEARLKEPGASEHSMLCLGMLGLRGLFVHPHSTPAQQDPGYLRHRGLKRDRLLRIILLPLLHHRAEFERIRDENSTGRSLPIATSHAISINGRDV